MALLSDPSAVDKLLRACDQRISMVKQALKKDPKNLNLVKALQEASVAALAIKCVGRQSSRADEQRSGVLMRERATLYRVSLTEYRPGLRSKMSARE